VAPRPASGARETGASEQGGEEGGRCELTGTIEGERSRDEGRGGIGYFIVVKRRGDAMPDRHW
jgi:hypothetical protein